MLRRAVRVAVRETTTTRQQWIFRSVTRYIGIRPISTSAPCAQLDNDFYFELTVR
jgi:hypothetical protein